MLTPRVVNTEIHIHYPFMNGEEHSQELTSPVTTQIVILRDKLIFPPSSTVKRMRLFEGHNAGI